MNKKEIIKILDLASFVAVIIATFLVVLFQITGIDFQIKLALVMYDATTLMLSVMFALKLAFSLKKQEDKDELFVLSKKQLGFLITKLALSIIAFIAILVVVVIY